MNSSPRAQTVARLLEEAARALTAQAERIEALEAALAALDRDVRAVNWDDEDEQAAAWRRADDAFRPVAALDAGQ